MKIRPVGAEFFHAEQMQNKRQNFASQSKQLSSLNLR